MSFLFAMKLDDLWVGEKRALKLNDQSILLVRTEKGVFACRAECPHKRVSLCEGDLSGSILTCPAHHWEFDIETGKGVNPQSAVLVSIPLKIEKGEIWIDATNARTTPFSGPTVHADKLGHAIAAAISEFNPGTRVSDRGSYLRIESPSPCRLSAELLEKHLNRAVDFPMDIELAMSAFRGRMAIEPGVIIWNSEARNL